MQNTKDKSTLESILKQGVRLKGEGKLTQAIEKYSEALKANPNSVVILNQLAGIYESKKEFEQAINCYQRVVEVIPNNAMAYAKLARAMMRQRKIKEAITAYQKAITLKKKHPEWVYLGLGTALKQNKQKEEAIAIYQQGIEFDRQNPVFYLQLAQLYFEKGDLNNAIESYEKAIKFKPQKQEQLYKNFSEALTELGQLDKVMSIYRSLIQSDIDLGEEAHCSLGEVIIKLATQQGELDSAVSFFEEAIDKIPHTAWLHYYLGTALVKQGRGNKALISYRESIKLQPEFYLAHIESGKLLIQKDSINETLHCCVKALEINPKDVNTYILCQRWLEKFNSRLFPHHFDTMEKAYQNAIVHTQDSKPHLIRLYINMGNLFKEQGKFSEAILCNQNASYHTTLRANSSFVKNYWQSSKPKEPDFMIIGVMKCGTTSLFIHLAEHPYILPSIQKETSYLSGLVKQKKVGKSSNYYLDKSQKDWYLSYFPLRPESGNFITGESSNEYIFTRGVENIVFNNFPNTKLIAMLRDPVKRAISQYHMLVKQGREFRSLEESLKSELEVLEGITDLSEVIDQYAKGALYLAHGLYVYFLERWMKLFSQEQLLILATEDLSENPGKIVGQVFEFLGLHNYQGINYAPRNTGSYPPQVDEELLSRLYNFYRPHNQRLEEYLGRKFNWE